MDIFYEKVREDTLIGAIFEQKIKGKWEKHLEKIHMFWQTVLLKEQTYYGSPFPLHAKLPIDKHMFSSDIQTSLG